MNRITTTERIAPTLDTLALLGFSADGVVTEGIAAGPYVTPPVICAARRRRTHSARVKAGCLSAAAAEPTPIRIAFSGPLSRTLPRSNFSASRRRFTDTPPSASFGTGIALGLPELAGLIVAAD